MQNNADRKTGVSPAYFVSRCGSSFGCSDVIHELPVLASMGFRAVQFEVFEKNMFQSWMDSGVKTAFETATALEISVSAFVAHFAGAADEKDAEGQIDNVLKMLEPFDHEIPVVIPMLPGGIGYEELIYFADAVRTAGRIPAVEVIPGSEAESYSSFLNEEPWKSSCAEIAILLDTGHANVMGEDIPGLIKEAAGRIKVLHLSDNDGMDNLSLKPGDGNIDWEKVIEALDSVNFTGSLDLEITAESGMVGVEYEKGRLSLNKIIRKQSLLKELS